MVEMPVRNPTFAGDGSVGAMRTPGAGELNLFPPKFRVSVKILVALSIG